MNQSYQVEITQTLQRIISLEYDSPENAIIEIHRQFNHEEIVLDDSDYIHTDIRAYNDDEKLITESLTTVNLTRSDLRNLETLLDYIIESEQTSYEEYLADNLDTSNNPDINHIYAVAQRIKETMCF